MPLALLLSLCLGCNNGKAYSPEEMKRAATADVATDAVSADSTAIAGNDLIGKNDDEQTQNIGSDKKPGDKKPGTPPAANPDWDKKIVKTADLTLEVKNYGLFARRLHQAVKGSGGYIAQEEQKQSTTEITNTVTIKVPVAGFDDLLLQLPADSDRLVDKKISSQDVTMEIVDTKSRLETKKEVRERYLELLRQAHNMKDILAVQNEINDLQQEMDQASGRIAWLGHSAAFSTINLTFYQSLAPGVTEDPTPSFLQKLKDSLVDGWQGLSSFLLGILRVWPLWIALGAGVYWVRKAVRSVRVKTALTGPREEAVK